MIMYSQDTEINDRTQGLLENTMNHATARVI